MQRRVLAAAVVALALAPSAASAAVRQVDVLENNSEYCITVDNGPASVDFSVRAPDGGVISSIHVATSTAGTNCNGDVAAGQSSFFATTDASGGATVVATANTGVTATFPVPYSSYDHTGATTGSFKVGGLPAAGGTVKFNGGGANAYTGSTYATPAPITISGGLVAIASTIGAVPYLASLNATQFHIEASYYGQVTVHGVDPLGAPVTGSVASGGAALESGSTPTAVDSGGYAEIGFGASIPAGAVVTAGQTGWFTHTATLGTATVRAGGFDVAIPNAPGESGDFSANLAFQKTSGLPSTDGLSCRYFGDASFMFSSCGTATARYSGGFTAIVAPGDDIYVDTTEGDGDSTESLARPSGLWSDLDDGSLEQYNAAPGLFATFTATTPTGATASNSVAASSTGYAYLGSDDGDHGNYVPLKIVPGTTVVVSGAAVGAPRTYVTNLAEHLSGTSVVGTTYANGHLAIEIHRSSGNSTVYGTADGSGAFSIDVGAILPTDYYYTYATDSGGATTVEDDLYAGIAQPAITGLVDQQLVRGTITPGATGGGPGGISWHGEGPGSVSTVAPFTYSFDTTLVKDGTHRIEASSTGGRNTLTDYLYVRVDNTPPVASAGTDQSVGLGQSAVFVTGAHDANGIASITETFGDGKSFSQPTALLGLPITHSYTKAGTYTATVVVTDMAGNTTTDTASIHVIGTLASQVGGKLPASLKHKKNLKVKLTGKQAGQLSVRFYGKKNSLKAAKLLVFKKANQKVTLSVATKKWKRGSYLVVLQFTDVNGSPGPVVLKTLKIS